MNLPRFFTIAALLLGATGCNRTDYSWESDLQHRLAIDFCRTRAEVTEYIHKYIPEANDSMITAWTNSGKLEAMTLDGELRYFKNAAPNLFRIDEYCNKRKEAITGKITSTYHNLGEQNIQKIAEDIRSGKNADKDATAKPGGYLSGDKYIGEPVRMRVRYTLTVDPGAVPDGETIRCWLPYPRADVPRQKDVKFIEAGWTTRPTNSASPQYFRTELKDAEGITFSGNASPHSSLYMEAKASSGWPTVFYEEFEYTCYGEWFPLGITPEDTDNIHKNTKDIQATKPEQYLGEREKHIIFTPEIIALRDSLTQGISEPVLKAKAFYEWIDANFPWASAREYSTIPNIPEYVLANGHGDCGQVSLLFITLCRSAGIPARFQSGFMMHPGDDGLHDWSEIWLEEYGWVPVDQSFGGEHYLGAIDSYRFVVNNDYGQEFIPKKKYPRSETVDFQRGEVEWKGGNLYFDNWDYKMEVTYIK